MIDAHIFGSDRTMVQIQLQSHKIVVPAVARKREEPGSRGFAPGLLGPGSALRAVRDDDL